MRVALVLTPPTNLNFRRAAQIGVSDYVARYGAVDTTQKLEAECARASALGLRLSVVEGYIPFDDIIHGGPDRDAQIANVQRLIEAMGQNGVEILCYNWMPNNDWTRTGLEVQARGGALTNEFDLAALESQAAPLERRISAEKLWGNLAHFLEHVVPVAEAAGVKLAMHPDDPPLPQLLGAAQIMHQPASFERLFELNPSPANGLCVCTGTFASAGEDVPVLVRRFGSRVHYAHFRDVRGTVPHFVETFHDDGESNMPATMRAFRDIGFGGPMRPDHVPKLEGEEGRADGYTMLGRLFAVGYLRGLMQAIASEPPSTSSES